MTPHHLRLGVNIDHVATVRNARGGTLPDPLRAARLAEAAGADGITAHLREDRRHIVDADIDGLMRELELPLNFEMAATEEMVAIALRHRPHAACIVPEKREERTTEGGLDAAGQHNHLRRWSRALSDAGIRVSLFIEPDPRQLEAAVTLGRSGRRAAHRRLLRASRARPSARELDALARRPPRLRQRSASNATPAMASSYADVGADRRHPRGASSSISAISWSARRSSSGWSSAIREMRARHGRRAQRSEPRA